MNEPVYVGQCSYAVDAQRRVPLYKEWRSGDEPPTFYLVPGRDGVIHAMPEAHFYDTILKKARAVSIANSPQSKALALMGSRAHKTTVDKQGRIKFTPELMEHAGVTDQVFMVGGITTIQIMAPETWDAINQPLDTVLDTYEHVHNQTSDGS